jgi:multidrug efflux pump subunit AcrA (membrane-fusion protein)
VAERLPARQARARRRRRRMVIGSVTAVVVFGGGGVAWAMTRSSGPGYRLASVTRASVAQTVTSVGTISSVNQSTLRFPVNGTVAGVSVAVGDSVSAGQTVATLDATALEAAVRSAQVALANAQQTLAQDEASQTGSTTTTSSATTDSTASVRLISAVKSPAPSGGSSTAALIAAVQRAQQKVIADQHTMDLDADIAKADQAIVAENTACQAIMQTPGASSTATPSPTGSTTPSTADDLQSCQEAIAAVQAAQKTVQADEDTLAHDEQALDRAVTALLHGLQSSGSTGSQGSSRPSSAPSGSSTGSNGAKSGSGSNSGGSGGSNSGSGRVVTAAQLAADQKEIDSANAQLALAQQNVSQAALKSPIAGTVAAVSMTAGSSVSTSSTSSITIIGAGQRKITVDVGLSEIDLVRTGEHVQITVDGVATPLTGKVTLVGILNTSGTSGSTSTYPVTVLLDPTSTALFDGAGATVAVDVGSVANVLTVPTSALHAAGAGYTVTIDDNGTVRTVRVTVGMIGTDRSEIRSGLSVGQEVVLADVGSPVPSSSSANRFVRGVGGTGLGGTGSLGGR